MGDVAMTVPVVRALAGTYPQLRISVLSRSWARPLFEAMGPQVGFVEADVRGRHKGIGGLLRLGRELRRMDITHVADMHSVLRSHVLRIFLALSGAHTARLCKHRSLRRRLCKVGAAAFLRWCGDRPERQLPSVFDGYADVLGQLGFSVELDTADSLVLPTLADSRVAESRESTPLLSSGILYGIAPFAAHPGKELPQPMVEQLIDVLLTSRPDCAVILFGRGRREDAVFASWRQRWPGRVAAAADTCRDIMDELRLMGRLSAMLSMDSANQHLCSLLGTRVVTVWGQTHPVAGFAPWGQQPSDSIQVDKNCRPCSVFGNRPCRLAGVEPGRYPCLEAITVRQVAEAMMARQVS